MDEADAEDEDLDEDKESEGKGGGDELKRKAFREDAGELQLKPQAKSKVKPQA